MRSTTVTIETSIYWDDPEDEDNGFHCELEIEFEISGEYRPATWGYYGGSPEEWPEAEVVEIYCEHGPVPDQWIFGGAGWDPPWKDQLNMEALEREALEKASEYDGPDYDDAYEDYCDRHY
jgi:hypothetical protein